MPKIKTHSGAKKRFKLTGRGKAMYKRSGARHLLIGMSAKRGRWLRRHNVLPKAETDVIKALMPYA